MARGQKKDKTEHSLRNVKPKRSPTQSVPKMLTVEAAARADRELPSKPFMLPVTILNETVAIALAQPRDSTRPDPWL